MGAASIFVTLPLGIALGSWLGVRFGARAVLLLLFPFPIVVHHLGVYSTGGAGALAEAARGSLASVPMVVAWSIPHAWLARRWDGRGAGWSLVALALATAVSAAVLAVVEPVVARLDRGAVGLLAVGLTAAGHAALRVPPTEPPLPVRVSPANLGGRLGSLLLVLIGLALCGDRATPLEAALATVLTAFPRMTMELSVSTWIGDGPRAARQVLAGLPVGLCAALAWCLGVMTLPGALGGPVAIVVSLAAAAAVTGSLALDYRRRWPSPRPAAS